MRENELFISAKEYDFNTVNKVMVARSSLATIRAHEAQGGYLLTFHNCACSLPEAIAAFRQGLTDVKNNKWIF